MNTNNNYKDVGLSERSIIAINGQAAGQNIENHFHQYIPPEEDEKSFFKFTGLHTSAPQRMAYRLILERNVNVEQLRALLKGFHLSYSGDGEITVRPNKVDFVEGISKIFIVFAFAYGMGNLVWIMANYPQPKWWDVLLTIAVALGSYGISIHFLKKYYYGQVAIYFKAKYLEADLPKLNEQLKKKMNS